MPDRFDVAVIGGGPAGSAVAIDLACRGRSVALLERTDYSAPRIGEVLPAGVRLPLRRLGVWERFLALEPLPSPEIRSAWGSDLVEVREHIYGPYGPSWHVDRARFDEMLADSARQAGVELRIGARVVGARRKAAANWTLELAGGHEVSAGFVVDATGRASSLARRTGAKRVSYDYLVAVVGTFVRSDTAPSVLIESVEDGWWYSAPIPGDRMVVALMTEPALLPVRLRHAWRDGLARAVHTRARIDVSALEGPPRVVSAASSRLPTVAGPGWIAVGDAACAVDPLAGQGVYRALESGLRAASVIAGAATTSAYVREADGYIAQFLALRRGYYTGEQRWPSAPFWRSRHALIT